MDVVKICTQNFIKEFASFELLNIVSINKYSH